MSELLRTKKTSAADRSAYNANTYQISGGSNAVNSQLTRLCFTGVSEFVLTMSSAAIITARHHRFPDTMDRLLTDRLLGLNPLTILWSVLAGWLLYKVTQRLRRLAHSHTTPLAGPPNPSLIFGVGRILSSAQNPALIYEQWAEKYGPVYRVPAFFGYTRIVLCDPKAVQHFYSRETFEYRLTKLSKRLTENIVRVAHSRHIIDHIWERTFSYRLAEAFYGQKVNPTGGMYKSLIFHVVAQLSLFCNSDKGRPSRLLLAMPLYEDCPWCSSTRDIK